MSDILQTSSKSEICVGSLLFKNIYDPYMPWNKKNDNNKKKKTSLVGWQKRLCGKCTACPEHSLVIRKFSVIFIHFFSSFLFFYSAGASLSVRRELRIRSRWHL